jgi:phospholipid-transporting ATPase
VWQRDEADNHSYLDLSAEFGPDLYFIRALTFLVAYSHLIPISLYVALKVVKLALAYLITQDVDMYYEPDDRPAVCKTSDLVEELG